MTRVSIEDANAAVSDLVPRTHVLLDDFEGKSKGGGKGYFSVTDYGSMNRKVIQAKYSANKAQEDKKSSWAIQVPIGLIATHQVLHILVQDVGSGTGIGHSYTCVAKGAWSENNWYPECFYFGSAAPTNNNNGKTDSEDNFKFYFMANRQDKFADLVNTMVPTGTGTTADKMKQDYMLYLGLSEFYYAGKPEGKDHTLTIDVTSSAPIRWCLPGDKGESSWRQAGGCTKFDPVVYQNFWEKTTADSILSDTEIFPTDQMIQDDPASKSTAGRGGVVNPFLSMEDIAYTANTKLEKAKECWNSSPRKYYNPNSDTCQ